MKKLLMIALTTFASSVSFAENLQCEKSYEIFNKQGDEEIEILKNGSLDDVIHYYDQIEYDRKLKPKHPGQTFSSGEWISDAKYREDIQIQQDLAKDQSYKNIDASFLKPKLNYISSIGEVCVVPMRSHDEMFKKKMLTEADVIFVRDIKTNDWRRFIYLGVEDKKDFVEFFPDFPKSTTLSKMLIDNKDFAESASEFALLMLVEMEAEITPELKEAVEAQSEPFKVKLKANGY
ncbi:hypothetical protein [Acinetobacter sp.]|jgi:hypothetical protein|uniref:hypothetical protein n=1 Tax=Acinetobacter sp. TaxID=472 RepID=UPI002822558D|nr:hypothetical protein [Acinetobacter sp.]MDR0235779.1 hypothetical protein [Acinetobacter sp.]